MKYVSHPRSVIAKGTTKGKSFSTLFEGGVVQELDSDVADFILKNHDFVEHEKKDFTAQGKKTPKTITFKESMTESEILTIIKTHSIEVEYNISNDSKTDKLKELENLGHKVIWQKSENPKTYKEAD